MAHLSFYHSLRVEVSWDENEQCLPPLPPYLFEVFTNPGTGFTEHIGCAPSSEFISEKILEHLGALMPHVRQYIQTFACFSIVAGLYRTFEADTDINIWV